MKHLSIIIPIFNVRQYIERCIYSLENQDIPKDTYEIICINDGSTDKSEEVVFRLQKEFANIILINQINKGVSAARNRGIDLASGKYLIFIDPDDYVDAFSFSHLLENVKIFDAEVSFLGFTVRKANGTIQKVKCYNRLASKLYNGLEAYYLSREDGQTDPDRIWAVLLKKDFIKKHRLHYLIDVPYLEDGELIARILCLAERCIFDGRSFYQRTTRLGSATQSGLFHTQKAAHGFVEAACNLKVFQYNKDLNSRQRDFLNQPILKFILLSIQSALDNKFYKKLPAVIKRLRERKLHKARLESCESIYRMYGKAYNISPYIGAAILFLYPMLRQISKRKNWQSWHHKIY